jgi:hypothetical protein
MPLTRQNKISRTYVYTYTYVCIKLSARTRSEELAAGRRGPDQKQPPAPPRSIHGRACRCTHECKSSGGPVLPTTVNARMDSVGTSPLAGGEVVHWS